MEQKRGVESGGKGHSNTGTPTKLSPNRKKGLIKQTVTDRFGHVAAGTKKKKETTNEKKKQKGGGKEKELPQDQHIGLQAKINGEPQG